MSKTTVAHESAITFLSPLFKLSSVLIVFSDLTRPEKSLHFLVKSPETNLHFLVSPERALHLFTG